MAINQGEIKKMTPRWIAPQLATLVETPFSDKNWIFEEKFDGFRCIAIKSKGKISLFSRNHKSLNQTFPEIVHALEAQNTPDYVIDGEIVAMQGKLSSFALLQNRLQEKRNLYFYVFDLLIWGKATLVKLPLLKRKELLKTFFPFGGKIRYTPHVVQKGELFFQKMCRKGSEGAIAKRANAPYVSKRTRDWLKFKCSNGQEMVIGGYTDPQGSRINFGALLVGYYDKGSFHYAGKIGTGFDTKTLHALGEKLKKLERKSCPFSTNPKEKGAHFVSPILVCEVAFTEWTRDGKLRHGRMTGLRKDKAAKSVVREKPL